MPTIRQLCGWVPRPDEVKKHLSQKQNPTFKTAAPNLAHLWQGEEVALWEAVKKVNGGKNLTPHKQTIGDCVSHGYSEGTDYLHCINEAAGLTSGWDEQQTCAMSEYIYGCSRMTGDALGPSDGSNGIWAIKGMEKYGYIPRKGTSYDGQKAKQYGWRGVPQELLSQGKNLLTDYALLEEPQDMANALKSGRPCPICSDQGFTMTRDANGICRASGSWSHCMVVIGMFQVSNKWYFVILQSWGDNTPDGPVVMGTAPTCAFGCDWDVMGRILRQHDSFALNAISNWEPMPVTDWIM